jgi:hypothetical protein
MLMCIDHQSTTIDLDQREVHIIKMKEDVTVH